MTPEQFDVIAWLKSSEGGPAERAARLVLLEGITNAEAARQTGIKPPSVTRSVRRYREAWELIEGAWSIS